jgi:hypothetical protein
MRRKTRRFQNRLRIIAYKVATGSSSDHRKIDRRTVCRGRGSRKNEVCPGLGVTRPIKRTSPGLRKPPSIGCLTRKRGLSRLASDGWARTVPGYTVQGGFSRFYSIKSPTDIRSTADRPQVVQPQKRGVECGENLCFQVWNLEIAPPKKSGMRRNDGGMWRKISR